jgi:hypothetical protein
MPMYTTKDDRGLLNNYASEPPLYFAEFPSPAKQRQYWIQGSVAAGLVAAIVGIALVVS